MLKLRCKLGETLAIGDKVKVTVVHIEGNQVKLGTAAPQDITIHREEIHKKIQEEKKSRKLRVS